jgi:TRAP-type mannitol/chloroaromatic compound transport system permease small subunit
VQALAWYVRIVDRLNGLVGHAASWLILPVVLISFTVVMLRYVLGKGYPWLQESYIWLHGLAFMLAAAWVLREEGHVRVDLFYRRWSARGRAWADLIGVFVFMLPMLAVIFFSAWPLLERSWRIREKSPTADGLEWLFLLKTAVPIFCVLVALQGLAMAARSVLTIAGRDDLVAPARPGGH